MNFDSCIITYTLHNIDKKDYLLLTEKGTQTRSVLPPQHNLRMDRKSTYEFQPLICLIHHYLRHQKQH